jgi:RHS repeat-associated protein
MPVITFLAPRGLRRDRDGLGSVVATYKDGWLTADRSYDPYGETRAEWNDVGRFGWVGGLGYRETRREWVSHYVRARHYGYPMGMWTSVDPLWPSEPAFGYVSGMPTALTDSSGARAGSKALPVSSIYPSGRNYGCTTYPCCEHNTRFWKSECKSTGSKFVCCAERVSGAICKAIKRANSVCSSPLPAICSCKLLSPALSAYCLDEAIRRWAACELARASDCQNSCMRYRYQTRTGPLWAFARRQCSRFGPTSKQCCVASIIAEQREYETCARVCFPSLNVLPHSLRVSFGVNVLRCCG